MTFLNPIWLFALPLIALPILIHLLNQRRHRTIDWGAMQFLLSAKRMSRGMARLRQILIMAARMLVIAGLIFAICRPLSSGWVGTLTGGKPETVIVLLDRSASMQQQQLQTGQSKLSSGRQKMVDALRTLGIQRPVILIESSSNNAFSIDRPEALLDLPAAAATESQADLAAMLQTALNYISDNQTGRTDIWICSDAAKNDWNPESSRWNSLKSGFSKLEGIRFHVLNFPEPPQENLSIVVDRFERVEDKGESELVIDLTVQRTSEDESRISVPIAITINGLRSVIDLELEGTAASLLGHRVPIDGELKVGWGQVELPIDGNASDNNYFFAFADPAVRRTVIVSDSDARTLAMELAAETSSQNGVEFGVKVVRPEKIGEIDWQQTAMLIWQAQLPVETVARQITSFVESGRTVIFLPPTNPDSTEFAGASWGQWQRASGAGESIGFWNNDSDLLSKTRGGQALPVNDLLVYRHCQLHGDLAVLAKLENGSPLLARLTSNAGAMYFLTTWPLATHSSLDREGVTLFAMTHRAIARGAESLGAAKQFEAGSPPAQVVSTMPQITSIASQSTDVPTLALSRPYRAGVYGDPEQMIAINRPLVEDHWSPMTDAEMGSLFEGLDYQVIDDTLGSGQSLASEIWKVFVAIMGIALLIEAVLCMPPKSVPKNPLAEELEIRRSAA